MADHRAGENLQPCLGTLGGATVGTRADLPQVVEGIVALVAVAPADDQEAPGLIEAILRGIRVEPHSAPPNHLASLACAEPRSQREFHRSTK
jgi:hypothetical protein